MKLRWSNGHDFAFEFEANDPDLFHEQALSALRSFRIATQRCVTKAVGYKQPGKRVIWYAGCSLGVYGEDSHQWYYPEGEPTYLDTQSFGTLGINRHFDIKFPFVESDPVDDPLDNLKFNFICFDPGRVEDADFHNRGDSDRVWNLCIGSYQHEQDLNTMIMSVDDAIDKHIKNEE